jgi:transcriptional repressor NrdR
LVVVKKDGARVPFDREHVLHGIIAACGKRPVPEDQKEAVADAVEIEVRQVFDREVPSVEIGRRVADRLREVDSIAYIRYASEYYEFRTLEDLAAEVSREQSRTRPSEGQGEFFAGE